MSSKKYKVLCWGACEGDENNPCGINYISTKKNVEVRAETGAVVDDLPADSWLIKAGGYLEEAAENARVRGVVVVNSPVEEGVEEGE